jgi:hypothetical protein
MVLSQLQPEAEEKIVSILSALKPETMSQKDTRKEVAWRLKDSVLWVRA